jgi:short-subunit dehydrogenase
MSNKVCAVVGAGPGLGAAIARRFGREGYHLALLARRLESLEEQTQAFKSSGIEAEAFQADASEPSSLENAFQRVQQQLGNPEVLVYNAAALKPGRLKDLTSEDLVQDFKVNLVGAMVAVQQVVAGMREQKRGTILLTGGGLALEPSPQYVSLSIGKAAIRNFCFSLAKELERDGIHVATVTIAGFIRPGTKFAPDAIADTYWQLHSQEKAAWQREIVYQ